jgi:hypothetical protein
VPNVEYVAVLHDVLFAFKAQDALCARGRFAACREQVVPADGLGADEVMFEVGVNGACGLRGLGASCYCPGAALVFAGGKKTDQAQQFIAP